MKKIGLISCSPNKNSLSAKGLHYAKTLIERRENLDCSLFLWRSLWAEGKVPSRQLLDQYSTELSLCHGYIWAVPVHCGSASYHAAQFLEQFSESLDSKIHGIILSAGSTYFYMGFRDISFQLMIETNGIVLPRPAFICANELINEKIPQSSSEKIHGIINGLEKLIPTIRLIEHGIKKSA